MADKPDGVLDSARDRPAPVALRDRLAAGQFAITAEIGPPRGADTQPVADKAAILRGWVDGVNITDNQGATVHLSSLAGSLAALQAGVSPIMQLTCRDRNRIALQSELLSAGALGIPNVIIMTGDHPSRGDHPDATPVFDLDSTQLLGVATRLRDEGTLMSGAELTKAPDWLLGAVENPPGRHATPEETKAAIEKATGRVAGKVEAGAQFLQTNFVFDVPAFAAWLEAIGERGLLERCAILAGVGPVRSQRALEMLARIPGVTVPEAVSQRLAGLSPDEFRAEGEKLCSEIVAQLTEVQGVSGVHIMAINAERSIPGIIQQAGLPAR